MGWIQKLTPIQEEFVDRFKKADLKYFFKVMSNSIITEIVKGPFGYQLELPVQFIDDHAHEFDEYCTFETKSLRKDSNKKWPVRITVRYFVIEAKKRVFAYGNGGWKAFITDNNVKIDDLLVFQLIGFSQFRIYIFPASQQYGQ